MTPTTYRKLRTVHKWAGIVAALWLFVLGITGVLLDHHEWRWLNQISVPQSWSSERVAFLVPGTPIRHIAADNGRMVGASERGAWYTDDGQVWTAIDFVGMPGQPQTNGIATLADGGFAQTWLATDEGLWRLSLDGASAFRAGLQGQHLTALSAGSDDNELVTIADKSDIVIWDRSEQTARILDLEPRVSGLSDTVALHRFVMDMHFGRALLPGDWGILLNDIGGIAMAVLSLTGILYWLVTRPGRRKGMSMRTQRNSMRWLFRFHAPVIGLVGLIPILYLSLTAFPLNHIYGFIEWAEGRTLDRASLPPAYRAASLDHEIESIVAIPGEERMLVATRYGVLETRNEGRSWHVEETLPVERGSGGANLFRVGDVVFAGYGAEENFAQRPGSAEWTQLEGTGFALTTGARDGDTLFLKNSRAIYSGSGIDSNFADTGIDYLAAAPGTPLFLYIVDIHVGLVLHSEFKWANDLFAGLALILALSGPFMWLKRKWI